MKTLTDSLRIDWDWVGQELSKSERISSVARDSMRHAIHASADDCLKNAKSLVKPKAISITRRIINIKDDSIEIEGAVTFSGKRLSSYIKGATHLHLFLVTLGGDIETEASRWMSKGEGLYGYLLDRIGSLAVESLAEATEDKLREIYLSKDESISMRLSPGYCDWPIEEQFVMARALDFSGIGVSLTEKCMMVPRKSISAMVGVGPKETFSKNKSQCTTCERMDCDYRRTY